MNRLPMLLLFLIFLLPSPQSVFALDTPSTAQDTTPQLTPAQSYAAAKTAWVTALELRPTIAPLQATVSLDDDPQKIIKNRLKDLETKIFSNREWRSYWELQATTAAELSGAMGQLKPKELKRIDGKGKRRAGLDDWANVALEKVTNQDSFYAAIQQEKDLLEARLEILLERQDEILEAPHPAETTTPYQQRAQTIIELDHLIEVQLSKQVLAKEKSAFISQQDESAQALLLALVQDLALAEKELAVATTQVRAPARDGLLPTWQNIKSLGTKKVRGMRDEISRMTQAQRVFAVEKTILGSEVDFRTKRLATLRNNLEEASSTAHLMDVIRQTTIDWVTTRAPRILIVLFLTWIGVKFAIRLLGRGTDALLKSSQGKDAARQKTLVSTFSGVVRLVIYLLALLMALEQLGFNTDAIMGSAAIFGLAISFGAKNLVQDVVNGFFILLENQFAVGEFVEIAGKTGTVQRITIRTTWLLHGGTGDIYAIPNGSISGVRVHSRDWGRAQFDIGVAYSSDINHVEAIIKQVGRAMKEDPKWGPKLLDVPFMMGVADLGDSAIMVRIRTQTKSQQHWAVKRELLRRFKVTFDKEGIEFPFPQMVIHKAETES